MAKRILKLFYLATKAGSVGLSAGSRQVPGVVPVGEPPALTDLDSELVPSIGLRSSMGLFRYPLMVAAYWNFTATAYVKFEVSVGFTPRCRTWSGSRQREGI